MPRRGADNELSRAELQVGLRNETWIRAQIAIREFEARPDDCVVFSRALDRLGEDAFDAEMDGLPLPMYFRAAADIGSRHRRCRTGAHEQTCALIDKVP